MIRFLMTAGLLLGSVAVPASAQMDRERASAVLAERLPDLHPEGEPGKCGFPVILEALENLSLLPPLQREAAEALLQRPARQKNVVRGAFRIHYDTTGTHTPAMWGLIGPIANSHEEFVDSVGAIINRVHVHMRDSLGYIVLLDDRGAGGGNEYDIYISNLSESGAPIYGRTFPEPPALNNRPNPSYPTYMEIHNTFGFVQPAPNRGLPALRVTLAHEFFHAVQIRGYGLWGTDDVFFYEISSVWMEEVLFPEVNDYVQYLRSSNGHFRNPHVRFNSSDFIMYSRGIWGLYVEKKFGAHVMRNAWEHTADYRPLRGMDLALQNVSSSFRDAFSEWTLWNHFTHYRFDTLSYYAEGYRYPLMSTVQVFFSPPDTSFPGFLPAFGTRYYQVVQQRETSPGADSLYLILSNINMTAATRDSTTVFPYTYALNTRRLDDSYLDLGKRLFAKLTVADELQWYAWRVDTTIAKPPARRTTYEVKVYPNPYVPGGGDGWLNFSITSGDDLVGTLTILSSSTDLVYTRTAAAVPGAGINFFRWDGRTDKGEPASSGIYFYILEVGENILTGKFALIRR